MDKDKGEKRRVNNFTRKGIIHRIVDKSEVLRWKLHRIVVLNC